MHSNALIIKLIGRRPVYRVAADPKSTPAGEPESLRRPTSPAPLLDRERFLRPPDNLVEAAIPF